MSKSSGRKWFGHVFGNWLFFCHILKIVKMMREKRIYYLYIEKMIECMGYTMAALWEMKICIVICKLAKFLRLPSNTFRDPSVWSWTSFHFFFFFEIEEQFYSQNLKNRFQSHISSSYDIRYQNNCHMKSDPKEWKKNFFEIHDKFHGFPENTY